MRAAPLLFLPVCSALAGCGAESYSADLKGNTVPYFELQRDLNTNLGGPDGAGGVTLRVPRSFAAVPPPPKPTDEELEDEFFESPRDERQPAFLTRDLPGLSAAWTFGGGAGQSAGQRFLYLLDSRDLEDDPVEPGLDPIDLPYEVVDRFAEAFNLKTPQVESYVPTRFPQSPRPFAPPVQYRVPPEALTGDLDGVEHTAEVYLHEAGGRNVLLVLVAPTDALTGDRTLTAARDLMLQTLDVSDRRPTAPETGGGGRPVGGGVAF